MSSITASEVQTQPILRSARHDLLVLWQNRETRAIHVIGRLTYDGDTYRFGYTRRAGHVAGFTPLPGLREISRSYQSDNLFPLFAQRVMDPSHPGYERYLSRLGLSPGASSPWEQILRSGGVREGDTLQFLPVPHVQDGIARATFLAHGVRWVAGKPLRVAGRPIEITGAQQEHALATTHPGSELGLLPEPENPSSSAAMLITAQDVPVGYVPEVLAAAVGRLRESARVHTLRINGPDAPPHLRLLVELEATVNGGFTFDPHGNWESTLTNPT